MIVFFVWPLVGIAARSVNPGGVEAYRFTEFTFANYKTVFGDAYFRGILLNTAIIAAQATLISLVLAYPTAYFITRLPRRFASVVLVLILVPFLASILVRLYAFTQILGRKGIINSVVGFVGLGPFELLFNRTGAVIGMVDFLLPYLVLTIYGVMAGIDQSLITAAKSLGATPWQAFRTIFFPLSFNGLVASTLLAFVLGLGFFLTPAILGGPRDVTVAVYIQQEVSLLRWGTAAAMGILLLVLTTLLFVASTSLFGFARTWNAMAGGLRGAAPTDPLKFTPVTALLAIVVVGVIAFLMLPLLVIVPVSMSPNEFVILFPPRGLSLQWYRHFFTDYTWTQAAAKSLVAGVAVSALATCLALATAVGLRSAGSVTRKAFHLLIFGPLIVPVILTAIAMFQVESRLYLLGTLAGLVFAHTVLALPYAFLVVSVALAAVDDSLEEVAQTLGASKFRAFLTTTGAIIAPSILGAATIAFLISWDEVVVSLFQTGIAKTLPVLFFSHIETGVPPTVAAVGTMVIAMSFVVSGAVAIGRRYLGVEIGERRRAVVPPPP
jgi:putative spermidine/putrescine transport system permease protein